MATNLATTYVAVVPSMEGVQGRLMRGLVPAVGNASDRAGREGGKRMGSALTDSLKKAAGVAVAAVGFASLVSGMKSAITEAGNLEQSVGSVAVVFGKNATQMDEWARKSAKTLGLSRNEYNEFATLIGSQLKNAGVEMQKLGPETNKLITLGADLASMYGGTTADAVAALSSTLKGEMDPIQGYGITLTAAAVEAEAAALGFEKVGDAFTTEAKAAATSSLIMEQANDAHGMFADEATTYAGQVARLGASWTDLSAKIGELFLPAATNVIRFFGDEVVPIFETGAGGVRAFREAWTAADGDVTSSGFAGFMERTAFAVQDLGDLLRDHVVPPFQSFAEWAGRNAVAIESVAAVLVTMTAGFYANTVATVFAAAAAGGYRAMIGGVQSRLLTARIAVMYFNAALLANPIGLIIAAIAGLIVGIVLLWKHSETFRRIVTAVWDGIKAAADAAWTFLRDTVFPAIMTAVRAVGDIFSWLYKNVILPVWTGIKTAVAIYVAIVMTIFDGIVWVVRNTLGKVFVWLYEKVIKPSFEGWKIIIGAVVGWVTDTAFPAVTSALSWVGDRFSALWTTIRDVWDWIRSAISVAWTVVRDSVFRPLVSFLSDTLGPAFTFVWEHMIRPVWERFQRGIMRIWEMIRDKAFRPMADFVDRTLGSAFRTGVDAITKAWEKVRKAVSGPVDFVINTVINDGFIKNFNTIAKKFGIGTLDEIDFKGFRDGGRTGGSSPDEARGIVHGREFVLNERRTRELDRAAPGFLDDFHRRGLAALDNPSHMAVGARVYAGAGSFSNPLQHAIARTGVLNVAGSAPGWSLGSAVAMMDRATAVKVRRGGGYPRVNVDAGHFPAWWAGYYQGNSVMLNDSVMGGGSSTAKRTVAAHELGHALGLPHSDPSGLQSIMSYANMYRHNSVTNADVAALSAIYGGSGKAGGGETSPEDEKPGLLKRLGEWLKKTVGFDSLLKKIPGGEFMKDVVEGAMKKAWDGFQSWVTKAMDAINPLNLAKNIAGFLGIGDGKGFMAQRPTVFDGGGWLEQSAQPQLTWHREKKPDAVLTNEDYHLLRAAALGDGRKDGRDAPLVGTLQAFDMDEALRKLRAEEKKKEALFR